MLVGSAAKHTISLTLLSLYFPLPSPLLSPSLSSFGPPLHMREDRTISWDQLQQSILSKLYYLMLNGSQAQVG